MPGAPTTRSTVSATTPYMRQTQRRATAEPGDGRWGIGQAAAPRVGLGLGLPDTAKAPQSVTAGLSAVSEGDFGTSTWAIAHGRVARSAPCNAPGWRRIALMGDAAAG